MAANRRRLYCYELRLLAGSRLWTLDEGSPAKPRSFKLMGSSTKEPVMETTTADTVREPWNKGKLVGQKTPFKLKEIWVIRIRLQIAHRCRDLALFNLVVDSKLRACDLMTLRVRDVCHGQIMASRALILQQKTSRPVQFEITEPARTAVAAWITHAKRRPEDFLFPSRIHASPHLSTRQYARIVDSWVLQLGIGSRQLWHSYAPPN
jgi:site-specific recombinase XerC